MTDGERIQKLRNEKGWTQGELGIKLGVSQQSVGRWESGLCSPKYDNVKAMSRIFDVPMSAISERYQGSSSNVDRNADDNTFCLSVEGALDYLDYVQKDTNYFLKSILVICLCTVIGIFFTSLSCLHINSFVLIGVYLAVLLGAYITIKKLPKRNRSVAINIIESGNFRLSEEAKQIIEEKKASYIDSAKSNDLLFKYSLIAVLLWVFGIVYTSDGFFSNSVICFFIIAFSIILSTFSPLIRYYFGIKRLLHETAPQISTPFHKTFWS